MCWGGVRHRSTCTPSGSLGSSQVRQFLEMPTRTQTLSGMFPRQLFRERRAQVTHRDRQCPGWNSPARRPALTAVLCCSQQDQATWARGMQAGEPASPTDLGCCYLMPPADHFLCRSCKPSAAGQRCLHQVFTLSSHNLSVFVLVFILHTQNQCPEPI